MSDGNFNNQRYLNNAQPLDKVHSLEIVSAKGYVLAVLRGRDLENLYSRAGTMATCMGWKGAEYRERQA